MLIYIRVRRIVKFRAAEAESRLSLSQVLSRYEALTNL